MRASLYGLDPYSEYSVCVEAVNTAGSVVSPWVGTRTLQASPAGLSSIALEQREQGRALLLTWDPPHIPNGVITVHTLTHTVYRDSHTEWGFNCIHTYMHTQSASHLPTDTHTHISTHRHW